MHPGPWLLLAASALAARVLVWIVSRGAAPLPSDPRWADAARHLAHGLGFSLGAGAGAPTASIPPLAPVLLALLESVAGARPDLEAWLGIGMSVLALLAIARLGTALHGPTAGRAAAWCALASPLLLRGSSPLESSTFALTLVLALVLCAEWLRTPRPARAFGAGLVWGACALSWTPGLILPAAILAWAWRPLGLTLEPGDRLRQCGFLALGLVCVVAPWMLRNGLVVRAATPTTTSTGIALLAADNPTVWDDAARTGGRIDVLQVTPYATALAGLSEPARDARARDMALAFVRRRGAAVWARVTAARVARLANPPFRDPGPLDGPPRDTAADRVTRVLEIGFVLVAVWGAVRSLSGPRRWFQSLPLVAIVALASIGVATGDTVRARLAFEPLIALLAAVGFQHARRRMRLRRRGLKVIHSARA